MTQTKEDLENIKSKLIDHIKSTYDETKANEFINNIDGMNDDQFIEFLKKQGLIGEDGQTKQQTQCIFCSMIYGEVPTTKIDENEKAISILELNSVSAGHSLIIPKEHVESKENLPEEANQLAKQVSEKLQRTFKPSRIDIVPGNVMGHEIINLIPIFKDETINSQRQQQTPESLAELKKQIEDSQPEQIEAQPEPTQIEEPKEEENKVITEEDMILPKRIP